MGALLQEAGLILDAAEASAAEPVMTKRLGADYVRETRDLESALTGRITAAKSRGAGGNLRSDQRERFIAAVDLLNAAKDSAKRSFPDDAAKLGSEFLVGRGRGLTFAHTLQQMRMVRGACRQQANATVLRKKGWLPEDTDRLSVAIEMLESFSVNQDQHFPAQPAGADARNVLANELYERLLTIQNAVNIEWPERTEENRAMHERFRFEIFPPAPGTPLPRRDPFAPFDPVRNGGADSESAKTEERGAGIQRAAPLVTSRLRPS